MRRTVPTAIVGSSTLLREGVTRILNSARFRVFASKPSVTELELEKFPQSEPWLLSWSAVQAPRRSPPRSAPIKEKFPLVRVALLGHHWGMSEITAAFQAGANAYFAEATASDELSKLSD